ncbi:23S rRNA (uracil(1939)-C(5))-methyltransferase RlmD [Thermococcus sp. M39]|uniref:23S rRNA (uracil(1939)-C(5))-methyltransferase RlmD n=1 Tax=unclassified Thermococcus TaxID=2627626 RepID=UPI001439C3E5|nr:MULTISPECIES: 23S rRNA (uracil(1939)-C(5))-methyltransferase RlmD [unclassified Thermococcus]NJE08467.1 23S rRNA (uracil(1939)-C(5))-methyltransferase RlmD [Thermococcus sp. M39]NJE11969.1 23S rRNA (uracil(1939)-C(5))-methyltransferase RlmD [Thermococcus sp. LS2]
MRTEIKKLSEEGFGVAKVGRRKIYVPFTAIGDVVEIKKWHREKKILVAHDYDIIEFSPLRVEPKCEYFGKCGGCILQHLPYEEQVRFKEEKLEKILGFHIDVLPSPKIYGHRNRIDVIISTRGIGFRRRGTWWDVVNIEKCEVFGDRSKRALKALREFMEDYNLEPWDLEKSEGFMRYIVMREGKFTGEFMINLVTNEGPLPEEVSEYFDFADSIYWSINASKSDVSYGEPRKFWGSEFIREKLDDVVYLIHPNSFFQTNSYQAVTLVKKVAEFAEGEKVLDLYSGVGTFGIYLAKRGFKVEGIEVNPFAVEMAKRNAEINNVDARFYVGEDKDVENLKEYDTLIVDPPRAGLHPKLIRRILRDKPETVVYVSCNPKTLSKNLEELKSIYKIEEIIGLDMFPHTPHIEVVTKLKLKV